LLLRKLDNLCEFTEVDVREDLSFWATYSQVLWKITPPVGVFLFAIYVCINHIEVKRRKKSDLYTLRLI
jgi:hypothetical protein